MDGVPGTIFDSLANNNMLWVPLNIRFCSPQQCIVYVQFGRRQRLQMPIIMCGLGGVKRHREIDVSAAGSIPQRQLHLSPTSMFRQQKLY